MTLSEQLKSLVEAVDQFDEDYFADAIAATMGPDWSPRDAAKLILQDFVDNGVSLYPESGVASLQAQLAEKDAKLVEAINHASDWAQRAGEAIGKLEASEMAGVVDGWREKCERLEAQLDEAIGLIERIGDLFSDAVQADCENGVKWLNERAAKQYLADFPATLAAIKATQEIVDQAIGADQ